MHTVSYGSPKHIESPNSDVCDFIDQYVSCALPADDCKLRELVCLLQQHTDDEVAGLSFDDKSNWLK